MTVVELVTNREESDAAFRLWADALLARSSPRDHGWVIEGTGVAFSNYGHGEPGTIENEVMLGTDQSFESGVVKIVEPEPQFGDKRKLTLVGRTAEGRLVLLRAGWLRANKLSGEVKEDFAAWSGLAPIPLMIDGVQSQRQWFVVADLSGTPDQIVSQTADFALACARVRARAGGGDGPAPETSPYSLGLDEKGRVTIVERSGGTAEICHLHGYVWEALQAELGGTLVKPTRYGFAVDAVIEGAGLLIEIKTGVAACDFYEAIGQLKLYPALIGLEDRLTPILLVPNDPIPAAMAAAVAGEGVAIYTYSVGPPGEAPQIEFSDAFLDRCRTTAV